MIHLNEYVKGINEVRLSDLKHTVSTERTYNYHPKNRNELIELVEQLIKERGNNADLNDIDTGEMTDMWGMFYYSEFNGDISEWDVSNVTNMAYMFCKSKFNGDISQWDVSKVKDMSYMFQLSRFKGDVSDWDVQPDTNTEFMFSKCPLEERKPPKWYKRNNLL